MQLLESVQNLAVADLASPSSLPSSLATDRKTIESIKGIRVLADFHWFVDANCWGQLVEIDVGSSTTTDFPVKTKWYITCSNDYPQGDVRVWPAKDGGISITFPHQELVEEFADKRVPWLKGHICITGEFASVARSNSSDEPRSHGRLTWIYYRAIEWCTQAAKGELLKKDDRFEIPALRTNELDGPFALTQENQQTFGIWSKNTDRVGFLSGLFDQTNSTYRISSFLNFRHEPIVSYEWHRPSKTEPERLGFWVMLDNLPVVAAWHTPRNWKELYDLFLSDGIDLLQEIRKFLPSVGFNKSFLVAIGFSVPEKFQGPDQQVWWYACAVPPLLPRQAKGFRYNSQRAVGIGVFANLVEQKRKIDWLSTRNFDRQRIFSRGALSRKIAESKILVIGAGALGSAISELLVRGGCESLEIVDPDKFDVGNLSRHTLVMSDLFKEKVKCLARRLTHINPFVEINSSYGSFKFYSRESLQTFNLIIDCTGDDDVIETLSITNGLDLLNVSLSLGFEAKKSYLHLTKAWNPSKFFELFQSFITEDHEQLKKNAPNEGIGCWHYAFPADASDVWTHASIAVKIIDWHFSNGSTASYLLEKTFSGGVPTGISSRKLE